MLELPRLALSDEDGQVGLMRALHRLSEDAQLLPLGGGASRLAR
jgi:hypothetical protein